MRVLVGVLVGVLNNSISTSFIFVCVCVFVVSSLVGGTNSTYEIRSNYGADFYSYSILRTIVLVPPTPLLPELLRSLVSTMAAAGSSALPSPVSGQRPN